MEKFLEKLNEDVMQIIEDYDEAKLDVLYKKIFIINSIKNMQAQSAQLEMLDSMKDMSKNIDFTKIDFNSILSKMS